MLGMALSGPDTGMSQWFINLSAQPHLDGTYTVFGKVVGGAGILIRITQGDVIRTVARMTERTADDGEDGAIERLHLAARAGCVSRRSLALLCRRSPSSPSSRPPADAQFFAFGQNKIQYRKLDWRVMKGPHVDLYYYSAEAELAPAALAYAEASYDTLSVQFGHTVPTRIPLIVYASHTDFEQTNILPFTPPEGLLGATDFLKRRVALPFRGNFAEFRHTHAPRDGARVPARHAGRELQPRAPGAAASTSRSGGARGWRSSGRRDRTRATRW